VAGSRRRPRAEPLRTSRLRLDPLTVADADEMVPVLADPALYRFTGGSPPSAADLRRRYRAQVAGCSPDGAQGWLNWIVREVGTGRPVGYVQATVEQRRGRPSAEVAWVIEPGSAGRGFASEAAAAMVGWLCARAIAPVTAHVHPAHHASARVAERIGLVRTGAVVDGEDVWSTADPLSGGRS
jgi:RimJ/RimL family protein N-acetyltransferase